ncbi:MYB DNA-binding domain protein [Aspergillus ibericus CBS 121593]|uniref:MYB DNA-binding domain protein n=1 Tax=Aspergillus ibericus CBS 121593 TaxID=1448316 RepID=A0A395GYN0_9EURO|nr:hypothetical protein BO80DRAFT_502419 [Aspergillus ibericus CBS 121593]RAL00687.1 hypothetical protein BO80DRAFT_502419 [Aspergillus ibericus CBS 121593]
MGNSSSQPADQEQNGTPENFDTSRMAIDVPSSSPKSIKRSNRESQPDGSTTSKRKRKALSNATNDQNRAAAAPNSPQSPPHNSSTARPAKRKKVTEPKQKQTQSRKAETAKQKPNDAPLRDAAPAPQTLEIEGSNGVSHNTLKESSTPEAGTDEGKAASSEPAQDDSEAKLAKASDEASENPTAQGEFKKGKRGVDASKGKEGKLVGFFTAEEVKNLEKFKLHFCTTHGVSSDTFDLMVQHSERDKSTPFPCHADVITKPAFWKEVYEIIPNRDKRSVYRFMRRHFQCSAQKPHHWTHEQDDELILLHKRHGPKWAYIAKMIGRSDDDVVQRWKNRLEHRRTMNRGPWSEVEVRALQEHLQSSWTAMKETGHDVGRDIYEMDESLIAWGLVSNKMNNCRSRQQCADKWRKVRRKVLAQRTKGNPDAFYDPVVETKPPKRRSKSRSIAPPQSQSDKQFKSAEFVNSDDDSEEEMTETPSVDRTSEGSSPQPSKPAHSKARSHEASDKSDSDSSDSEDESDSDAISSGVGIKSENRTPSESDDGPSKPKQKETLATNGLSPQRKRAPNGSANKGKATKASSSQQQGSPVQQKRKRSPVASSESGSESESEDSEESASRSPPSKRVSKPTSKASHAVKPQEKTRKADTSSDSSSEEDESDDSSASDSKSRSSSKKAPITTAKLEENDDQSRRSSAKQGLAKPHKVQAQMESPRIKRSSSSDDSDSDSDASSDDSSDSVSSENKPAKSSKRHQQAASASTARKPEKPSARFDRKADVKHPKSAKSSTADSSDTSSSDEDESGQSKNTKTDSGSQSETDSSESSESGSDL